MFVTYHRQSDPRLYERLNPVYWHPAYDRLLDVCTVPVAELGEFITHISYGPIVTGKKPPETSEGVRIIHQGQIAETGVDPREAILVPEGSEWDGERARVRRGDILLPRSGVASLAKNRVAIFLGEYAAVVGSFVDLIRLDGIDPIYALLCFKSELVWSQIHRRINGVGTPNISFGEIRSLKFPILGEELQLRYRVEYLEKVHGPHLKWVDGDAAAGEAARNSLRELKASLDEAIFGG